MSGELPLCSRLPGECPLLVFLQINDQGFFCGSWFMDMTRGVHRTCIRIRMISSILELRRAFVEGLHCFLLLRPLCFYEFFCRDCGRAQMLGRSCRGPKSVQ
jgi:hypothetical protein